MNTELKEKFFEEFDNSYGRDLKDARCLLAKMQ